MENASKALIMAGSVLIALMIIGALILMFSNLSSYQETDVRSERSSQVAAFNSEYETYNRTDVRGSELYSLLNKVIDYNRRETTQGTGWSDQGQYLAFEPMEIQFTIDISQLTIDGRNRLFTTSIQTSPNTYTVSENQNRFENSIKSTIDTLENTYGQDSLTRLTSNISRIFISDSSTDQQKQTAVETFNRYSSKKTITSWDDIKESTANTSGTIRYQIYQYYEYIQFKRAHFDSKNTEYNNKTGRIVKMYFEFTGKFN